MYVKIHKSYRDVVAVCDDELIGKYFSEDQFQLDVKENFYKGDEITKEELLQLFIDFAREDATFNIVGEQSVNIALKAGIIDKEGVSEIDNVPFALVLM